MLCRAALALLLAGAACAQTDSPPAIQDFHTTPDIQTARAPGFFHCDFFAQHPASGQTQVACYLGTTLVGNMVFTMNNVAFDCRATTRFSDIAWAFVPGTSPMIGYQLVADFHNQGLPLTIGTVPLSNPVTAVSGGTF